MCLYLVMAIIYHTIFLTNSFNLTLNWSLTCHDWWYRRQVIMLCTGHFHIERNWRMEYIDQSFTSNVSTGEMFDGIKQTMFQSHDIRFEQLLDITTWTLFSSQQFSLWLSVLYKVCNSMLFSYVNNTVLYLKIYMIQIMDQRFEGSVIHLYNYIAIAMPVFNVTPVKYMA